MSTAAVSSNLVNQVSPSQNLTQYFQTRHADLKQLSDSLQSGDVAGAQSAYNAIVSLGQSGPIPGGNAFKIAARQQDFTAVGAALQSGDISGAQAAFGALASTFSPTSGQSDPPVSAPAASGSSAASSAGPEIVLNLSSLAGSGPEQIAININPTSGGGEQVSLSVGSQGSAAQQFTFNLNANSNEQIVLNLQNATAATAAASSSTTTTPSSTNGGLSVTA